MENVETPGCSSKDVKLKPVERSFDVTTLPHTLQFPQAKKGGMWIKGRIPDQWKLFGSLVIGYSPGAVHGL